MLNLNLKKMKKEDLGMRDRKKISRVKEQGFTVGMDRNEGRKENKDEE